MKNYLIRLSLYIIIALIPISCGTRKVNADYKKDEQSGQYKTESSGNSSINSSGSNQSTSSQNNDKVDERQEQRITELFNENGGLRSRITELLNIKTIDKSKNKNETLIKYKYLFNDRFITKTNNNFRIITITKHRESESNRDGLYKMGFGIFGLAIIVFAVYKYITRNRIKSPI